MTNKVEAAKLGIEILNSKGRKKKAEGDEKGRWGGTNYNKENALASLGFGRPHSHSLHCSKKTISIWNRLIQGFLHTRKEKDKPCPH